jgi:hypothetical protein
VTSTSAEREGSVTFTAGPCTGLAELAVAAAFGARTAFSAHGVGRSGASAVKVLAAGAET